MLYLVYVWNYAVNTFSDGLTTKCLNQEDGDDDDIVSDVRVIGLGSTVVWLVGMTLLVAIISDYVVSTIEVPQRKIHLFLSFPIFLSLHK